jgi:hypothetical protein
VSRIGQDRSQSCPRGKHISDPRLASVRFLTTIGQRTVDFDLLFGSTALADHVPFFQPSLNEISTLFFVKEQGLTTGRTQCTVKLDVCHHISRELDEDSLRFRRPWQVLDVHASSCGDYSRACMHQRVMAASNH